MILYPNPKINLGLNVLRKREDGFHDLETLFVPVTTMHDELEINVSDRMSVDISPCDWDPSKDLTVRAYELLKADYDLAPVSIRLRKNVPVGAGLGGGSADCAFALRAFNDLFGLGLPDAALAAYAARLGSDCAFFIYNTPMMAGGKGDVLTPWIPDRVEDPAEDRLVSLSNHRRFDLSDYDIVVETPPVSVSTAQAYRGVQMYHGEPLAKTLERPVEEWKDHLQNSFEATVFPQFPQIRALKESFYERGAVYASMSGSGSSVFGLFNKHQ